MEIVQRTARLALSSTVLGELLAGFAIGSREAKSRSLNHTCRSIAAEHAVTEIIEDFPELTEEDIRACLAYAADREQSLAVVTA
ncbi:DUF433 domain-containing protein [Candidatus Chloroploca sp. Khr17]|uniref:DUF433 domain-containing protein n=1 Tax=Candidatus Chloroploca sp. Khr17 TaxID=2496869 RepID=UPI001F10E719|nr:DUF433 domain-containing protein [Candidatus Chloroploca sp. Khr17]